MTVLDLPAPAPVRGEATEFRLLGLVAVHDGTTGAGIVPCGPKQRALLATMVIHAGELLSVDRLVEELWGDRPPANAPNALQTHVARLRRLLPSPGHTWIDRVRCGPRGSARRLLHPRTPARRRFRDPDRGRAASGGRGQGVM